MSDLHYLLALVSALTVISMPLSLRSTAKRLHYRDRPLFWCAPLPLADIATGLLAAVLLIWALSSPVPALLWPAAALGLLSAGGAWWISREPQRLVRHR
ncbi:hypothetical protein ACFSC4_13810 [Deinococcus malanensis]|uniref:hypothetical protein n=1 Tax=Deinococcus malanensis TaxID=1706855 RepID=UPI001666CDAB|nr:hypothetical protein [Deinococcus malanensis]